MQLSIRGCVVMHDPIGTRASKNKSKHLLSFWKLSDDDTLVFNR